MWPAVKESRCEREYNVANVCEDVQDQGVTVIRICDRWRKAKKDQHPDPYPLRLSPELSLVSKEFSQKFPWTPRSSYMI